MTEHVRQKNAVQEIDDTELISSAIDKCNLRPEYKRLLKILYVERGCLEDVCDAVGRDYSTVSKWHKPALIRLVRLLQKQGKLKKQELLRLLFLTAIKRQQKTLDIANIPRVLLSE